MQGFFDWVSMVWSQIAAWFASLGESIGAWLSVEAPELMDWIIANWNLVYDIGKILVGFIITFIPMIIAIAKNKKAKKKAKTELEAMQIDAEILEQAEALIVCAETAYNDINTVLKASGKSAGSLKKDTVLTKLEAWAKEKGFKFNISEWSEKIDKIVQLTKNVNK